MSSRSQPANNATSSANAIALAWAGHAYDSFVARLWSFRPRRLAVACSRLSLPMRRWLRQPVSPVTDQRPDVVQGMEHRRGRGPHADLLVPGGAPRRNRRWWPGERSLGRPVPAAGCPGISVGCSSGLSKKQKVEAASTPTETGSALEDLIEEADADGGEVVLLVDSPGMSNGAVHDVVHGPQGDPVMKRSRSNSARRG